jgi:hypothetical protein
MRLPEVRRRGDRLDAASQRRGPTRQCRTKPDLQADRRQAGHFLRRLRHQLGCPSHRPPQRGDVGSKGDGEGAHAPGVESPEAASSSSTAGREARIQRRTLPAVGWSDLLCIGLLDRECATQDDQIGQYDWQKPWSVWGMRAEKLVRCNPDCRHKSHYRKRTMGTAPPSASCIRNQQEQRHEGYRDKYPKTRVVRP